MGTIGLDWTLERQITLQEKSIPELLTRVRVVNEQIDTIEQLDKKNKTRAAVKLHAEVHSIIEQIRKLTAVTENDTLQLRYELRATIKRLLRLFDIAEMELE